MATPYPLTRQTVFGLIVDHPAFSNSAAALAKLPAPSPHPAAGWRLVRANQLDASPVQAASTSRPSPGLEQLKPKPALRRLQKLLGLSSLSVGTSLQYHAEEKRLAVPQNGAIALALAVQFMPKAVSECAPILRSILDETSLPAKASAEQIGNALLLLHLASGGSEAIFSFFGISPSGHRWLSEHALVRTADVQNGLQPLQVEFIKALY